MDLGKLASGQKVADRYNTHIHQDVVPPLKQAFEKIHLSDEQFKVVEVKFDHVIGNTTCVVTRPDDEIVFAKRPKRLGLTRFVKNRESEPSSSVVCILMQAKEEANTYVLITAFVGEKPEPEPWDRNSTSQSIPFWNTHALVWGSEEVLPGTETTVSPW